MHEMTTDHVHEEIQLLANDFSTMLFETLAEVPAWRDYYRSHDESPALPVSGHPAAGAAVPARRPALAAEKPATPRTDSGAERGVPCGKAVTVFTHRDPVPVALSMIAMITYSARMHRSPVPVHRIAGLPGAAAVELMLGALVRDRDTIGPERSMDVRFEDFMADDLAVADAVFALSGEELSGAARTRMPDYLSTHQRGRLGQVGTSCEMFGLDRSDLERRFAPYVRRFLD